MTRKVALRSDWDEIKDDLMTQAVRKKVATHTDVRKLLLETGNASIVENAPMDYYWGGGFDGTGLNKLGKILMKVRSELKEV
jgi:ribA/ribD-fused uncharacterized protein